MSDVTIVKEGWVQKRGQPFAKGSCSACGNVCVLKEEESLITL